jgi:hypothetical protein
MPEQASLEASVIAALGELSGRLAFWLEDGRLWNSREDYESVAGLFARMMALQIKILHVHKSALPLLGLPPDVDPAGRGERRPVHPWMALGGPAASTRALSPSVTLGEGKDQLEIMIGAYQDNDPFAPAADAGVLLTAHLWFRHAFKGKTGKGWAYRHSANSTGWKLMHAPWERGSRQQQVLGLDVPELVELEGLGMGVQVEIPYGGKWARAKSKDPGLPWTAAWDINAQRLAACSGLQLGIGRPVRKRGGGLVEKRVPGYHYVTRVAKPFKGLIPNIMEPGWHTTPRVAMAQDLGIAVTIRESWVWNVSVAYLNPFYEQIRDARRWLDKKPGTFGVELARRALKQCYLQPLGRLRSPKTQGDRAYRPSWYDAVIGAELAREYFRLHQLAQRGEHVLAVYFDTIICQVPSYSDLREGLPPAITISDNLGKFSPVGVIASKDARAALYTGHGPDVGALVKAIKRGVDNDKPTNQTADVTGREVPVGIGKSHSTAFARPPHGGYPTPEEK